MIKQLKHYLNHPLILDLDIDAPETCLIHASIIKSKPFLTSLYIEWYKTLAKAIPSHLKGPLLEIGSGGGFFKAIMPDIISSDILKISTVDLVLDAQCLPFANDTLRGIVMTEALHHLPNVKKFFVEASRCIKPGGVIAMIEPWNSPWSRIIYNYLHHEPFSPDTEDWHFQPGGPLSQANAALPWIVFQRDRHVFKKEFPEWEIKEISKHTPFCYLLSGGVSMRSFLPGKTFNFIHSIEKVFSFWNNYLAMFATVILKKNI